VGRYSATTASTLCARSLASLWHQFDDCWPVSVPVPHHYGFKGRFIPEAQDLAAVKLLTECRALPAIKAGRIADAIALAAPIWASLPGAGYGQREHAVACLLEIYSAERAAEPCSEANLRAMFTVSDGVVA